MKNEDVQTRSYRAGLASGKDPATPYGIRAPEGLDPIAFAAGLIEGRALARRNNLRKRELELIC